MAPVTDRLASLVMVIEGDLTIPSPAVRQLQHLALADDSRTVIAVVSHGVWEGVHHVQAGESADEVVVTAYVGTLRAIAEQHAGGEVLTFVMKAALRAFRIELTTPLGDRVLRDGALGDEGT
jgi:hypothetical protein